MAAEAGLNAILRIGTQRRRLHFLRDLPKTRRSTSGRGRHEPPTASLVQGTDGSLYGTTTGQIVETVSEGRIFEISLGLAAFTGVSATEIPRQFPLAGVLALCKS
jgi:hypothetical protein